MSKPEDIVVGTIVNRKDKYDLDIISVIDESSHWKYRGYSDSYSEKDELTPTLKFMVSTPNILKCTGTYNKNTNEVTIKLTNTLNEIESYTFTLKKYIDTPALTNLRHHLNELLKKKDTEYSDNHLKLLLESERATIIKKAANSYKVDEDSIDLSKKETVEIILDSTTSVQSQYLYIVAKSTTAIDTINSIMKVGDQEELAEAFIKAKNEISKYSSKEDGKITTFVTKLFGESKYLTKVTDRVRNAYTESSSVKDVIDHLFGLMHEKYNKLIKIAGELQLSRDVLEGQVKALQIIEKESDTVIAQYPNIARVPSSELALNTNIKGAIKKYEQRLSKVEGSITAMQGTIVALGRDLPAHKADLEEEMAIGGLLSNVDDYQKMYTQIKLLVTEVTDATRAQTYEVVNNLMRLQIEDTHTLQLVGKSLEASKTFNEMLAKNSKELAIKVVNDSTYINAVVNGISPEKAKKYLK